MYREQKVKYLDVVRSINNVSKRLDMYNKISFDNTLGFLEKLLSVQYNLQEQNLFHKLTTRESEKNISSYVNKLFSSNIEQIYASVFYWSVN